MSNHQKLINNLVHLLITQSSLFTDEQKNELQQIIACLPDGLEHLSEDDIKKLANQITDWCESHPEIDDALFALEAATKERAPGSKTGIVPTPNYELNKRTLDNAIQQNSYSDNSQSSNSRL